MTSIDEKVEVDKMYLEMLEERSDWLGALEAAGVDNWSGYEQAQEILEGEEV